MENGLHGLVAIFLAGNVAWTGKNIRSPGEKFLLDCPEGIFILVQKGDPGPLLPEAGSQGGTDASSSTGYDDYFIFHFSKLFIRRLRRFRRLG
jgi:hypothetical protein